MLIINSVLFRKCLTFIFVLASPICCFSQDRPYDLLEKICKMEMDGDPSWRINHYNPSARISQDTILVDYDVNPLFIVKGYSIEIVQIQKRKAIFAITYNLCAKTSGAGKNRKLEPCASIKQVKVVMKIYDNKWKITGDWMIFISRAALTHRLKERIQEQLQYTPKIEEEKTPRAEHFNYLKKDIIFLETLNCE